MGCPIYYINLDHRTDRNQEMIDQFKQLGITNYQRFPAILDRNFPARGCSKSHIALLKLIRKEYENQPGKLVMILEDDFNFYTDTYVRKNINKFLSEKKKDWKVVLLGKGYDCQTKKYNNYLDRAISVSSAAGYIVNVDYIDMLLKNMEEGLELFEKTRDAKNYAIDMYWQKLQEKDFYIFNPFLGYQRKSYSDIEGRIVSY